MMMLTIGKHILAAMKPMEELQIWSSQDSCKGLDTFNRSIQVKTYFCFCNFKHFYAYNVLLPLKPKTAKRVLLQVKQKRKRQDVENTFLRSRGGKFINNYRSVIKLKQVYLSLCTF